MFHVTWRTALAAALGGVALAALTPRASADIMIDVVPSIAPNAPGSPSTVGYGLNAITGLMNNQSSVGNPALPTHYSVAGPVVPLSHMIVTDFPSWHGKANPGAVFGPAFANETGNRLHFGLRAIGDGQTQFSLSQVTFEMHSSDPNDTFQVLESFALDNYSPFRVGISWGADRVPGGGDDSVYDAGQSGALLVDELYLVGVGNAAEALSSDPGTTNQGRIDARCIACLQGQSMVTVTGTYFIGDGFSASADVAVEGCVPEPASVAMWAGVVAAAGYVVRRRRQRRQGVEA
jgi:hypothetical protein